MTVKALVIKWNQFFNINVVLFLNSVNKSSIKMSLLIGVTTLQRMTLSFGQWSGIKAEKFQYVKRLFF